jgi:hypothetical protein
VALAREASAAALRRQALAGEPPVDASSGGRGRLDGAEPAAEQRNIGSDRPDPAPCPPRVGAPVDDALLRCLVAEAVRWRGGRVGLHLDEVRCKPHVGHVLERSRGARLVDRVLVGLSERPPVDALYERHRAIAGRVHALQRQLRLERLERFADA